jgi:pyridoxal 5-phosphate dependent beta-lyase
VPLRAAPACQPSAWPLPSLTGPIGRDRGFARATRELLPGVGGWRVSAPPDAPTATTTLRPPDGVDVVRTRTRLLTEHGIVTSAIGPERAPGEMTGPVLRVSPHVDSTIDDLEALAAAL